MTERVAIRVESGPHRRKWCPVSVSLPQPCERPTLYRQGRNRPVPCQVEAREDGSQLWWLIESQRPHETNEYSLVTDERQRQPPARVSIGPSASGWRFDVRKRKVAEMLCPDEGVARLTLFDEEQRLAVFSAGVECAQEVAEPHRVRGGKPKIDAGSVFGSLAVDYHYVDRRQVPIWREAHAVRCYDGPEDLAIIDWQIAWHATGGSIVLASAGADSAGQPPVLRAKIEHRLLPTITAESGRVLSPATAGTAANFVLASGPRSSIAILADATSFGAPPNWRTADDGAIHAEPLPYRGMAPEADVRLALGESIQMCYRLLVFRSQSPLDFARERYLDFDCPPLTKRM